MPRELLGRTPALVLAAIARGVRHGFDIMDETGLPSGTVYPALSRLERWGFVRTDWEDAGTARSDKRPPRKYYTITPAGQHALANVGEATRSLSEALAITLRRGKAGR